MPDETSHRHAARAPIHPGESGECACGVPAAIAGRVRCRRARVGDARLHYLEAGDGEPVVLIHGLSGSSKWWAQNIPALAKRHRVYAVDLLHFGESRARHPFVLSDAAGHLGEWMERVGIDRAAVVGHSMGGYIAAELAAGFPDRVERLALVNSTAYPHAATPVGQLGSLARALLQVPPGFLPTLVTDAWRAGLPTVVKTARELVARDVRPTLQKVRMPALVVWGERDPLIPMELGRDIARHMSRARFVPIPRTGHNPMWDRPREFNRLLLDFLAEGAGPVPEAPAPPSAAEPRVPARRSQ